MNSFKTTIEIPVTVFYDHQKRIPTTRNQEGQPDRMVIKGVIFGANPQISIEYKIVKPHVKRLEAEAWEDYE